MKCDSWNKSDWAAVLTPVPCCYYAVKGGSQPRSQGLSSSRSRGREEERPWERGWVALTFATADEILKFEHSCENCNAALSCDTSCFSIFLQWLFCFEQANCLRVYRFQGKCFVFIFALKKLSSLIFFYNLEISFRIFLKPLTAT